MCCRLMAVDDLDPPKPAGKWCSNIKQGVGCSIYETRPQSCRDFICDWLHTQSRPEGERLPIELRPDRCKVMLTSYKDSIVAKVDPGRPDAYKREPMATLLKGIMRNGARVYVSLNGENYMMREVSRKK
jgi:hypothetical protein